MHGCAPPVGCPGPQQGPWVVHQDLENGWQGQEMPVDELCFGETCACMGFAWSLGIGASYHDSSLKSIRHANLSLHSIWICM